jgi:hypothetical protein
VLQLLLLTMIWALLFLENFTRTQNQSGNSQQQRYNNAMMIVLMVHTKE